MEENKKLSYEELENYANQLSQQAQQMYKQLQEMNMVNMFKRLDYLLKVVENGTAFSFEFLEKCTKEIEELMTPPEEESKQ